MKHLQLHKAGEEESASPLPQLPPLLPIPVFRFGNIAALPSQWHGQIQIVILNEYVRSVLLNKDRYDKD